MAAERKNARLPAKPGKSAKKASAAKSAKPAEAAKSSRKRSAPPETSDSEEEEEQEEAPSDGEEPAVERQPNKKAKTKATIASSASASASAAVDAPQRGESAAEARCLVCTVGYVPAVGQGVCVACGFIRTLPMSAEPNQLLLAERRAKLSNPGSTVTSTSQSDTAKPPKLGAYETELKGILERAGGDTLARFAQRDVIAHTDAIAGVHRNVYCGLNYQAQSPYLTDLIRSGHFKELTMALPVTLAEAQARKKEDAAGRALRVAGSGEVFAQASCMVERPVTDLQEFLKIVVVAILPSLFDRPRAMLDWLELSRSVINIAESADGWTIAAAYMQSLLADRVHRGDAFNKVDLAILQTAQVSARSAAAAAAPRAGGPAGRAGGDGARPEWLRHTKPGACREWNVGSGCKAPEGQCAFRHVCIWPGCDKEHQGRDCDKRHPSYVPRAPLAGGAHKRGRGGNRKAGPARK
jgi:hypothetical protein